MFDGLHSDGIGPILPRALYSAAQYLLTQQRTPIHWGGLTRAAAPHLNDRSNDGLRSSNLNDSPRNRCRSRLLHEQRKSENAE